MVARLGCGASQSEASSFPIHSARRRQARLVRLIEVSAYPGPQPSESVRLPESDCLRKLTPVTLARKWTFGNRIGDPSGFGRVHEAFDEAGVLHAAKFFENVPGAERELRMAHLAGATNVVPVVDSGEVGPDFVLVMPMAEKSLRGHIEDVGPVEQSEAIKILVDVAEALASLDGNVIHRDIKPENVLLLNGTWCLMDFGIAKYADAATEKGVTHKFRLSRPYGAPEQWLGQRTSGATDIYSFGVMAFELLQGNLPFPGPDTEDFREQHVEQAPPPLTIGSSPLGALVLECLFKDPGSRPTAANVVARLQRVQVEADSRWGRLIAVNHNEVQRQAEAQAATLREENEAARRSRLLADATTGWKVLSKAFHDVIENYLGAATLTVRPDGHWHVALNGAQFGLSYPAPQVRRPELGFDIIATSVASVLAPENSSRGWRGRSHSLFFADVMQEGEYGWFETAFMHTPFGQQAGPIQEPFSATDVGAVNLHHALGRVMGRLQVAWPFTRLVPGDSDEFVERWLNWFAAAAEGKLHRPSRMPDRDVPHDWRRS